MNRTVYFDCFLKNYKTFIKSLFWSLKSSVSITLINERFHLWEVLYNELGRALVVPLISGTRYVPRFLLKKGTRSVLCSKFEKRNAFHSLFLSKGMDFSFPFLCKNSLKFNEPIFLCKI